MNRFVVLSIALCTGAAARADIGPPPGKKLVPVTTVVETVEDYPDYAFFEIRYHSSPGPPPHGGQTRSVTLHFFAPGTSIQATGAARSGGTLYAVPRSTAERISGWHDLATKATKQIPMKHMAIPFSDARWMALAQAVNQGEVPGSSCLPFGTTAELPTTDPREAITVTYRIKRTSAGIEFLHPDETPQELRRVKHRDIEWDDALSWRWVMVGGLIAIALLLVGRTFIRRISPRV